MSEDKRTALKEIRVQQVKKQKKIIYIIIVIVVIALLSAVVNSCGKKEEEEIIEVNQSIQTEDVKDSEDIKEYKIETVEIEETEEERLERVRIEAEKAGYPEGVIELLSKNPETVDFVENYKDKKDIAPAIEIAELTEGEIPHLLQWDERWGYAPYGTSIVAASGCGPTCLSMVLSGLTGDKSLTPAKLAEYGTENHYINEDNDTYWIFMAEVAEEWDIRVKEKVLSEESLKNELMDGHPVICSVGPGHFTQIGHFIVLVGYEDGKIIVHDPFSVKNTQKRWEYQEFEDQIKSMWIYSMN